MADSSIKTLGKNETAILMTLTGTKVSINRESIDDIMASALEGGISYWCSKAEVAGKYLGEYASEQISRGGKLYLYDIEDGTRYDLNLTSFFYGIEMVMDRYPGIIDGNGNIDASKVDGEIADLIIQYAVFGEPVFC